MSRRTGTITIRDVANMAGVVPSTVSHVINNTAPVSDGTRQRVFDAIQKLGYRRNVLASSLRQQTTMTIGLLVPNIAEPLFAELVRGVSEEAAAAGYGVILGHTAYDPVLEDRQLARMLDRRVDGLIIVPDDEHRLDPFRHLDVPIVTVNRQTMPHYEDPPSVEIDNLRAGYLATKHLIGLGHTQIGMITNLPDCGRFHGYKIALEEAGLVFSERRVVMAAEQTTDLVGQGRLAMQRLLRETHMTACFVIDDVRAVGALEALHDAHIAVPREMALIGCGDLQVASLTRPRLTTISHPKMRLGVQAVRLLLDLFNDSTSETRIIMPVELVVRETCGALTRTA
jgi:LacI family transcriptional regulator